MIGLGPSGLQGAEKEKSELKHFKVERCASHDAS